MVSSDNVRSVRPGYGADPKLLYDVIGKTYSSDISKGTPFTLDMISKR